MDKKLVTAGLSPQQAQVYLYLIEHGETPPPRLARDLRLTRTNAYKILEKLETTGLVQRGTNPKRATYLPGSPLALNELVAAQRNRAAAQEEAVKQIMSTLLSSYHNLTEQAQVQIASGRLAVIDAYKQQIALQEPIYFVRSLSDITALGFESIHEIRVMPARHGQQRFGITPLPQKSPTNPPSDQRSNLKRTWIKPEQYDAPVEWSVSGPTLLIVLFGAEPQAITINNPMVADAFRQLWHLLDVSLRAIPGYSNLT